MNGRGIRITRPSQGGFSMVEVLVVMVILAVGILGLLTLQVMSLRGTTGSRGRETATAIAKGLLDQVQAEAQIEQLNKGYGVAKPQDFAATFNQAGTPTGNLFFDLKGKALPKAEGSVFQATWTRLAAKGDTPGASEYRVEVAWAFETNGSGVPIPRTVSMDRLITR